ncbi:hypothetical protein ACKWTF_002029 [Chironomus riparius]
MNSNTMIIFFICLVIICNLVCGKPVIVDKSNQKTNSNVKRPIIKRKSTKSSINSQNDFMPMISMQMINRNAMMHNKFESKQRSEQARTTKATLKSTINPLCASQVIPVETVPKSVRPNTMFTSYNWSPSR